MTLNSKAAYGLSFWLCSKNSIDFCKCISYVRFRFGDLLPQLKNLPFNTVGKPEDWSAASVLFLRSKAMRVNMIDMAKDLDVLRDVEGRDSSMAEEGLNALLNRQHVFGFLLVDGSRYGMCICKGYMLFEQEDEGRIRGLRLFIRPDLRRQGFAEHFFAVCMLLLRRQKSSGKLDLYVAVPRIATAILCTKGFEEVDSARQPRGEVEMRLDVTAFVSKAVLRPLHSSCV